jgi:hypothetical protein
MTNATNTLLRSPDTLETELGTELAVLNIASGQVFGMVGTARRIWQLLADPTTYADLIRQLGDEYDLKNGEAEKQVTAFLEDLRQNNLLSASSSVAAG